MPLIMRPTGLGSGIDKDRQDYTVYTGGWDIGRIYEVRGGPDDLRWFWSFTLHGPMTRSDRAATLEEAKAQFQKSWDEWKACLEQRGAVAFTFMGVAIVVILLISMSALARFADSSRTSREVREVPQATRLLKRKASINYKTRPPNEAASLNSIRLTEPGPLGIGYFSTSTTYRRTVLYALSRWGARSAQAFAL
jgi:hypothetical protein